jgi:hypothetical protein
MLKYGEKFYFACWWVRYEQVRRQPFRFRIDSIPYTGKGRWRFGNWYKKPHVYKRERSCYYEHKDFVRLKRSPWNLPDPWDDYQRGDVKTRISWKNKKIRKQYMKNLPV